MADPIVSHWWRNESYPRDKATVPGTGEVLKAGSVEQVKELWDARCAELGLTFDNELAVFGQCCCDALNPAQREEACAPIGSNTPEVLRQKRLITWSDMKAFFAKSIAWATGRDVVTQQEAERRAGICRGCPNNQKAYILGCKECSNIVGKIASGIFSAVGDKKTSQDSHLENCAVCACNLRILVHCPEKVLSDHKDPNHVFPSFCWQGKT